MLEKEDDDDVLRERGKEEKKMKEEANPPVGSHGKSIISRDSSNETRSRIQLKKRKEKKTKSEGQLIFFYISLLTIFYIH